MSEIAREIAALAPTPRGCAPLPTSDDGIRHLLALLVAGWPRDQIVVVLAAAPAIVEKGGQEPRWYGPEMFRGERWTFWRQAAARLQAQPPPAPPPDPEALAMRRDAEERERLAAAEADTRRRILEAVESPPVPNEWDRLSWRAGPRWRASVLFRPLDAQAVVAEELRRTGGAATGADLARALSGIELTDELVHGSASPTSPGEDSVITELRLRRERAAAEGRTLSLAELREIGRAP